MDRATRSFLVVFGVAMIGVLVAAMLQILNTRGIWIDEWMTHYGYTSIEEIMAITILGFSFIGVILGVAKA